MGEQIELTVEAREIKGKAVKALRKQGFVPGVIYGEGEDSQSVMAPHSEVLKAYKAAGKRQPIELLLGKTRRLVMIKSADIDPVRRELRHLSFNVVNRNEKVTVEVPIIISHGGETPAEKLGLVILKTMETVEVEALPKDLPDLIEAPGDKLKIAGDHLTVGDLKMPVGVTTTGDSSQIVATVYEPSALAAANDAGGDTEEPTATAEASATDTKAEK
ncbi:MAG TPA: 50S ribosomal protein L25 [Patescibacteria group bacterium]|jgi:large subunit ribosomal protein L25|nr:50S ribosomal protein L25 [Patescibacteria group bacterium]